MLIALCGKPSVGKSTFFKAATLASVEIASYPFTTLKSHEAMAFVKIECIDKEFNKQCNPRMGYCINHQRFVPFRFMDTPGLIEGSFEGAGMGNKFLGDLSQADVLIHVVDISGSTNAKGETVPALSHDPVGDIQFLEREIDLWMYGLVNKGWEKFVRQHSVEKLPLFKSIAKQLSGLGVTEAIAEKVLLKTTNQDIKTWSDKDVFNFIREVRKTTKPMIIAANKIDVEGAEKNLERLKKAFPDYLVIGCSGDSELALREAAKKGMIEYIPGEKDFKIIKEVTEGQKNALNFIKKNILERFNGTGVQEILNQAVFNLLKFVAIYPGGVNNLTDSDGRTLPDCFLMKEGSTALDFAFKLHSDFGNNFIRAIDVKKKMTVGKEYKLKNRDVIEIISGK